MAQERKERLSEVTDPLAGQVRWLAVVHPCRVPVASGLLREQRAPCKRDSQAGTLGTAGL